MPHGGAGGAAVLDDVPGADRRGDLAEHGTGHVAVVVRSGAGAQVHGQVDRPDREAAATDRAGGRVDALGVVGVDVRDPDLAVGVHGHAGGTVAAGQGHVADVRAVGAQVPDRGHVAQRVGHPHVADRVHRDALRLSVAVRVAAQDRAVRGELDHPGTVQRGLPDLPGDRVHSQAVVAVRGVQAGPGVRARLVAEQVGAVPGGPERAGLVDQATVAAATVVDQGARDHRAGGTVDLLVLGVRAAGPDVVVRVDRDGPGVGAGHPGVVDQAFVRGGGHTAVVVDAAGVGPRPDVARARAMWRSARRRRGRRRCCTRTALRGSRRPGSRCRPRWTRVPPEIDADPGDRALCRPPPRPGWTARCCRAGPPWSGTGCVPRPSGAENHSPTISPVFTSIRTIVPRADAAMLTYGKKVWVRLSWSWLLFGRVVVDVREHALVEVGVGGVEHAPSGHRSRRGHDRPDQQRDRQPQHGEHRECPAGGSASSGRTASSEHVSHRRSFRSDRNRRSRTDTAP